MGEHEAWPQPPTGLLPNGILPNEAASVIRVLDSERWAMAEERTAELIDSIQPNPPSEERRNAVARYVQRLIMKCFPCQVFTFGSVPLKTYLPDGDIDLTAFSNNQNLKDTWAQQVRDMLENEEKNENAEFRVKEVQYIQAEVKIIKCLVENIVVDISFNQLGGLCTLCFLEEVDNLINQNHLFKRSIILIKAWCYYESRILGAHHGLISTYALETLVLYIFHVFNNSFAGPLEVLYRFLEFFSKFDWDNFCVSLWGPVPISSLPNVTAEPPRKDGGELLLSKLFLDACSTVYSVWHPPESQGQPFISKHFNVIDPLRVNNNLGRSVSKGNFFRIRSAFAFGAKKLARLLECPKEDIHYEVNQFFMNTWDRHGSGNRPDAPKNDLYGPTLSGSDFLHGPENLMTSLNIKKDESSSDRENQNNSVQGLRSVPSQHRNFSVESLSKTRGVAAVSHAQGQKRSGILNLTASDPSRRESNSSHGVSNEKLQRNSKAEHLVNDVEGRHPFARTHSSPELTNSCEASYQGKLNRAHESGKNQAAFTRLDSGRKNSEQDVYAGHGFRSSTDGLSPMPSHQSLDNAGDANSVSNSYRDDSGSGNMGEEYASGMGTQAMHQDDQDVVNMMASSAAHDFNGQVSLPLNLTSGHLPLQISPHVLASMGYSQRNLGVVPTSFIESSWGANMQFPHSMVSTPLTHYFPGIHFTSNSEDAIELGSENYSSVDMNPGEADRDYWIEQDRSSNGGKGQDNRSYEMHYQSGDMYHSASGYSPGLSAGGSCGSSTRALPKTSKETRGSGRDDYLDTFHQENRGNDDYLEDRAASSRSFSAGNASSSVKSKTLSESSLEGPSMKISKSTREKRGRKTDPVISSTIYGKAKSVSEHSSVQEDEDTKDWNSTSASGTDLTENISGPASVDSLHVPRHQMPGLEVAQTSGSDSSVPPAPIFIDPRSRQRAADNSGVLPFTFYPTGPPVPFVAMLPVYNFPNDVGNADTSTSHFDTSTGHYAVDDGIDSSGSGLNFDSSEGLDQSEVSSTLSSMRGAASTTPTEPKPDILNGDFASHWQNLQFGRLCQNSRYPAPLLYPSPVMMPPVYLQGQVPWDGLGRPPSTNANLFTQLMSYGPRLVPVAPPQSHLNRPPVFYQHYVDEIPRYRSGTGTYLPNPKASIRDRHSTGARRGTFNYDRSDPHGDREGNWNGNAKSRAASRGHNRSQGEKPGSRPDRISARESRAERPWGSHRHESVPPFQSQNGPVRGSAQGGSAHVAYGMSPLPSMNPNGISSNGPNFPSFVMLYPYDHNSGYRSPVEQFEFGSLGPVGSSGLGDVSQGEGTAASGVFEEQRFHGGSTQRSPDQPSSPNFQREA